MFSNSSSKDEVTQPPTSTSLFGLYGGVDPSAVQKEYAHVLVDGETVHYACKTIRDLFIVTDRRILNVDKQGLTGSRKNYDSIAYNKIGRFAVEFGGMLGMVEGQDLGVRGRRSAGGPVQKDGQRGRGPTGAGPENLGGCFQVRLMASSIRGARLFHEPQLRRRDTRRRPAGGVVGY